MIPTRKPCRAPEDREYRGIPERDLPIRYQPRENCYIGITTPKEPAPEYRREAPEHTWDWPKSRDRDEEGGDE
jgi:hypothetical protein